jgi:hypothetical protein
MGEVNIALSTRNLPIGEINNICRLYDLEVDVKEEEIVLMTVNVCSHPVVVKLKNHTHLCVSCGKKMVEEFGKEVV